MSNGIMNRKFKMVHSGFWICGQYAIQCIQRDNWVLLLDESNDGDYTWCQSFRTFADAEYAANQIDDK